MATTYNNLAQAQAAYDTLLKQKQRVQRDDYINQQQAIAGVNNYLRQYGYNGGAAESILLRARGNRSDLSSYDAELANLAALISGFKSGGSGSGKTATENSAIAAPRPGAIPAASTVSAGLSNYLLGQQSKTGNDAAKMVAAAGLASLYNKYNNTK